MTMTTNPADLHVPGTRPYAWPWDGAMRPDSLALVVVQAPEAPPDGGWRAALTELSRAVRTAGGLVVEVLTSAPDLPRRIPSDSPGSPRVTTAPPTTLLPTTVVPTPADHRLDSAGWSGFHSSPLDHLLRSRRISQILMTGYWFEVGVHSTMRAANDRGYECLLVEDAVASYDPELTASAVSSILMSGGIFGAVGGSADVVAALARPGPTPR